VANAIDGKPDTGWEIDGPGGAMKHRDAIFTLAEPLALKNSATVAIRLQQNFGLHHTLGHFCISFGEEAP